jgi:hypothetical protein
VACYRGGDAEPSGEEALASRADGGHVEERGEKRKDRERERERERGRREREQLKKNESSELCFFFFALRATKKIDDEKKKNSSLSFPSLLSTPSKPLSIQTTAIHDMRSAVNMRVRSTRAAATVSAKEREEERKRADAESFVRCRRWPSILSSSSSSSNCPRPCPLPLLFSEASLGSAACREGSHATFQTSRAVADAFAPLASIRIDR